MTVSKRPDSKLFQVALGGLPVSRLRLFLERLSQDHSLLLPELTQALNDSSQEPIGLNYRAVDLSKGDASLKKALEGTEALLFVVPGDRPALFPACRALLFSARQYLDPLIPILILVDQSQPDSFTALARPIEALQLMQLAESGVRHVGIYPVCLPTGEGLYDALRWLSTLFATGHQEGHSSAAITSH